MILAAVLAAGTSSRMKKNKLALPWGKRTVLETTMKLVESYAFDKKMLILGYQQDIWYEKWEEALKNNALDWEITFNPNYSQGQGTSVAKVGEHLCLNFALRGYEGVMFFLGDQPLLEEETICQLIEVWEADKEKIVVPVYQGKRGNPAIFPRRFFADLMKLSGDCGARGIIEANPAEVTAVEVEDRGVAVDLDTAEVYERELQNWQKNQ